MEQSFAEEEEEFPDMEENPDSDSESDASQKEAARDAALEKVKMCADAAAMKAGAASFEAATVDQKAAAAAACPNITDTTTTNMAQSTDVVAARSHVDQEVFQEMSQIEDPPRAPDPILLSAPSTGDRFSSAELCKLCKLAVGLLRVESTPAHHGQKSKAEDVCRVHVGDAKGAEGKCEYVSRIILPMDDVVFKTMLATSSDQELCTSSRFCEQGFAGDRRRLAMMKRRAHLEISLRGPGRRAQLRRALSAKDVFNDVIDWVEEKIIDPIVETAKKVYQAVSSAFQAAFEWLEDVYVTVKGWVLTAVAFLENFFKCLFDFSPDPVPLTWPLAKRTVCSTSHRGGHNTCPSGVTANSAQRGVDEACVAIKSGLQSANNNVKFVVGDLYADNFAYDAKTAKITLAGLGDHLQPLEIPPWLSAVSSAPFPTDGLRAWFPSAHCGQDGAWKSVVGDFQATMMSGSAKFGKQHGVFGAADVVKQMYGNVNDKVDLGGILATPLYTICTLSRYTGSSRRRIFMGGGGDGSWRNWLHGHHAGQVGVAYFNGWLQRGSLGGAAKADWVVQCSTNKVPAGSNMKDAIIVNGESVGTNNPNGIAGNVNVGINYAPPGGCCGDQTSDWAVAEIITWDRPLTRREMLSVQMYLYRDILGNALFAGGDHEFTGVLGMCPLGWRQVDSFGADVSGCGLESCGQRYGQQADSPAACAAHCDAYGSGCASFTWAPLDGDKGHPGKKVCTIYYAVAATQQWQSVSGAYTQIMCVRQEGFGIYRAYQWNNDDAKEYFLGQLNARLGRDPSSMQGSFGDAYFAWCNLHACPNYNPLAAFWCASGGQAPCTNQCEALPGGPYPGKGRNDVCIRAGSPIDQHVAVSIYSAGCSSVDATPLPPADPSVEAPGAGQDDPVGCSLAGVDRAWLMCEDHTGNYHCTGKPTVAQATSDAATMNADASVNSKACEAVCGSLRTVTQETCFAAAKTANPAAWHSTLVGSWSHVPSGCIMHIPWNKVHWNTNLNGVWNPSDGWNPVATKRIRTTCATNYKCSGDKVLQPNAASYSCGSGEQACNDDLCCEPPAIEDLWALTKHAYGEVAHFYPEDLKGTGLYLDAPYNQHQPKSGSMTDHDSMDDPDKGYLSFEYSPTSISAFGPVAASDTQCPSGGRRLSHLEDECDDDEEGVPLPPPPPPRGPATYSAVSLLRLSPGYFPLVNGWSAYGGEYGYPKYAVADGICTVAGLIKGGTWGHVATLPSDCRPDKQLVFNLNNHAKTMRVDVLTNGQIHWGAGGRDHGWMSLTGIKFAVQGTDEKDVTLVNGWSAYGGVYGNPKYFVNLGVCTVAGVIKGGTWGHVATLPSDCRPDKQLIFNLNIDAKTMRVDVATDGQIHCWSNHDPMCPLGWRQVDSFGADVSGCGLESCGQRYGQQADSPAACAAHCDAYGSGCASFTWAPLDGDKNNPGKKVCTIYYAVAATQQWQSVSGAYTQIMCVRHWMSLTGITFAVQGTHQKGVPLVNSWRRFSWTFGNPTYLTGNGICTVVGMIKGGTWGHVATLPSDCRPDKRLVFNLNNHAKTMRVDVLTNGQIHWGAGGRDHGWMSLTGINFKLDSYGGYVDTPGPPDHSACYPPSHPFHYVKPDLKITEPCNVAGAMAFVDVGRQIMKRAKQMGNRPADVVFAADMLSGLNVLTLGNFLFHGQAGGGSKATSSAEFVGKMDTVPLIVIMIRMYQEFVDRGVKFASKADRDLVRNFKGLKRGSNGYDGAVDGQQETRRMEAILSKSGASWMEDMAEVSARLPSYFDVGIMLTVAATYVNIHKDQDGGLNIGHILNKIWTMLGGFLGEERPDAATNMDEWFGQYKAAMDRANVMCRPMPDLDDMKCMSGHQVGNLEQLMTMMGKFFAALFWQESIFGFDYDARGTADHLRVRRDEAARGSCYRMPHSNFHAKAASFLYAASQHILDLGQPGALLSEGQCFYEHLDVGVRAGQTAASLGGVKTLLQGVFSDKVKKILGAIITIVLNKKFGTKRPTKLLGGLSLPGFAGALWEAVMDSLVAIDKLVLGDSFADPTSGALEILDNANAALNSGDNNAITVMTDIYMKEGGRAQTVGAC